MPEYGLTILGIEDGKFLLSCYHVKKPCLILRSLSMVLKLMRGYDPNILNNPWYENLDAEDENIIESYRRTLVEKEKIITDH